MGSDKRQSPYGILSSLRICALPLPRQNPEETQDRDESPKKEETAVTRHLSSEVRERVFERAGYRCEYAAERFYGREFIRDKIDARREEKAERVH